MRIGDHEASAPAWQPRFIFLGQVLERVSDLVVRHDTGNAPAAVDLLFQFLLVHLHRSHENEDVPKRRLCDSCSEKNAEYCRF